MAATINKAGEGGGLPKGLSLFRFVLFSFVMLGAIYGGASLYFNAPPRPGDRPPGGIPSAEWQPHPFWLPSFIAIKTGIGVQHSPRGYLYSGRLGSAINGSASILLGMATGACAGWFIGEAVRRYAVRKRYE